MGLCSVFRLGAALLVLALVILIPLHLWCGYPASGWSALLHWPICGFLKVLP